MWNSSKVLEECEIIKSSAYIFAPNILVQREDHICKVEKEVVPKQEPCSTPISMSLMSEETPFILQNGLPLFKYDGSQSCSNLKIPQNFIISRKIP